MCGAQWWMSCLAQDQSPGFQCSVDDAHGEDCVLARDPRGCGYRATSWTVPLLAHHLRKRHGVSVSGRTLRRRLHETEYRWKRPRYVYAGRAAHLAQKKGR
jgi:transposase